eukprot:Clim_evm11s197 gene=Clim_evmTU11s197
MQMFVTVGLMVLALAGFVQGCSRDSDCEVGSYCHRDEDHSCEPYLEAFQMGCEEFKCGPNLFCDLETFKCAPNFVIDFLDDRGSDGRVPASQRT